MGQRHQRSSWSRNEIHHNKKRAAVKDDMQYCRHGFKILKIIFFLEHKDIKNNRMDHQEIWHMRALNKL